jgi:hypothetical protein
VQDVQEKLFKKEELLKKLQQELEVWLLYAAP